MNQLTPCSACPLRKTGAFSANSEAEIEFIQAIKQRQIPVQAGQGIVREGDASSTLYTLLSGWAFRYRTLSDGRRQIFNFLLPGDFIGLQHQLGQASPHGVEALTDVSLCAFPNERL